MTNFSFNEVETWLDSHPAQASDYIVRKANINTINKWLISHGFLTLTQGSRRGSTSLPYSPCLSPSSPIDKNMDSPFNDEENKLIRGGSKRYLRHNFAKCKSKSVFRTCEPSTSSIAAEARRNSFRSMRKYSSLPPSSNYILSLLIESKVRLPRYESSTLERKKQLRATDEKEFFLDIVKDIANDLDLKSLTHKITVNLSVLLDADAASLYIVEASSSGKKTLVSKIFDLHSGVQIYPSTINGDAVELPWGKGIIGHVAETGNSVILSNASERDMNCTVWAEDLQEKCFEISPYYDSVSVTTLFDNRGMGKAQARVADNKIDPRYNDEVDKIRNYTTNSLLCMPVRNAYEEILAVAQVINKCTEHGNGFTRQDEKILYPYLQFVGIAITNAQLMETSQNEYERNRNLLEVVHDLFEEQTSLENVILKILQRAQRLLKCERAAVMLLEEPHIKPEQRPKFSKVFELNSEGSQTQKLPDEKSNSFTHHLHHLAESVVCTGENLNIAERIEVEKGCSGNIGSLLAMPIRNRLYQIIGVAKIINKLSGHPFDDNDEQLFEAFTIFCGLGINNTMMYNQLEKAIARHRVSIEVLSYHATASTDEVQKLMIQRIPEAQEWRLGSLTFDDFSLDQDEMVLASVRMFCDLGLTSRLKIDQQTCGFKSALNDLECLAMFVGCLCHDLDHRGTNNAFQEKSGSDLALLYGTQNTMEQHHFNHAVMILNSEGHNILSRLSSDEYSVVVNILRHSILATDLTVYIQVRSVFFPLVKQNAFDIEGVSHREMFRSLLMTACDIAASTKPWEIQKKVAELVTSEFFEQGDLEKTRLKITPPALMDRDREHELPLMQREWIQDICLPLYEVLSKINPKLEPMKDGATNNMLRWSKLAQGQENGIEGPSNNAPSVSFILTEASPVG